MKPLRALRETVFFFHTYFWWDGKKTEDITKGFISHRDTGLSEKTLFLFLNPADSAALRETVFFIHTEF
jgi:hypothetical protein